MMYVRGLLIAFFGYLKRCAMHRFTDNSIEVEKGTWN